MVDDAELVLLAEALPVRKRSPELVLAALRYLGITDAATAAREIDAIAAVVKRRTVRVGVGHHVVLYPAIAEAARRVGATEVGLIDLRGGAGFNLTVDHSGIAYDNGQALGDMASPVQRAASVIGRQRLPETAVPTVVSRIGVDMTLDVTNSDDLRWLIACRPGADAEIALLASHPPKTLGSNLSEAVGELSETALPVVTTTWALSQYPRDYRLRFLQCIEHAGRTVAWVSAEGVGVAPSVPTLGDRTASGHSIIGLSVADKGVVRSEAVGRCWSQGRALSWLT